MREFKIQFILEDECIGNKVFGKLTYSLDEILEGITNEYICEKACESFSPANGVEADFKIIAKRQFTGLQDKNGVDIYEYMELDNQFEVSFSHGSYILTNISNGDIMTLHKYIKDKNGQVKITKEYTKI